MQKFGLDSLRTEKLSALELEIVEEQAGALGRAGKKLRMSLERYESAQKNGATEAEQADLINQISSCAWELLLQREFVGFVQGNMTWITKHYKIPREAIRNLGKTIKPEQ
ncbi:hypothetical protein FKG94_24190 [Exilibacterium tricleocarpae]|uniref:Uncharacterized protein n=1 Tax=Exilibacterium tricleocarpae TaxID=2591008 RepID=A0A545ST90_9GAMM|nr:DUF6665 family protein [Exilibacterium tricleocarpae]TQV68188.1 hypothetical protein FKG94_24190 [Exilibacterium tricleocarpae]